ncbi:MAG: MMPL family transporter [Dehalococcoidia bacterium]|nr:MMPL family transporter [Dehalococcoidia bacterium]
MFFIASFLEYGLTTKFVFTNDSEVKVGIDLIENEIRGPIGTNEIVVFESTKYTVEDPEYQVAFETLTAEIAELGPDIIRPESLGNFYSNSLPFLVSEDRGSTLITLIMAGDFDQNADNIEAVVDVVHEYAATETGNFVIKVTGQATIGLDNRELSQEDLEKGEAMGVPIALIILTVVLGAIAAALVPLVMAIVSIIVAIGISALVGTFFELSLFVTNIIITIIGLAVGIDYSLFVVSRYREERGRGLDKIDAIGKAGATAGRAVVFSGITVVLALVGMLLIPFNIFISIGLGAIFVVLSAMAAAMTLLPAILGIIGDKVNSLQIPFIGKGQVEFQPDRKEGFWDKLVRMVMAQPIISLLLTGGLPIALIIPFFNINTGFAGISTYPDELESKQAFLVLDEKFSFGEVTPAEIVIRGDISSAPVQAGIERLKVLLAEDVEGAFGEPRELEVSDAGTLAILAVPVAGDTSGEFSIAAVTRLNESYVEEAFAGTDTEIYVTDESAFNIEFFNISSESAKIVFPFVLGISFLLSRIREHYDQSGGTNEAVAFGIRSTGRLITGAALIMVAVFWGFFTGSLIGLQQMCFGLGLAILLDATIVRCVMVPTSMTLLGKWNWFLPSWLEWIPNVRVEPADEAPIAAPADD